MNTALIVMAILGCADSGDQCQTVFQHHAQKRYDWRVLFYLHLYVDDMNAVFNTVDRFVATVGLSVCM